jgi:hypothetical protein
MKTRSLRSQIRDISDVIGTMGFPSKMPGTSFGIPAQACKLGAILAKLKGTVCHGCYALSGNYLYPSVQKAQEKRLAAIASPEWTPNMVQLITLTHALGVSPKGKAFDIGWHRWHDSGDLQSVEHLIKICAVAALTPHIRHWLPTREVGILAKFKAQGGVVPSNLLIRVSATKIDGNATITWDTTSGVHDKAPAPESAHICPANYRKGDEHGKCMDCRACWSFEVKHVSYPFHN